jgi:hypothetical protein
MFLKSGATMWQKAELLQAAKVDAAYRKMKFHPSAMSDCDAEHGSEFLTELEGFAELLKVKPATRTYRELFSRNYQCIFKDMQRQYRFDLLVAMLEGCPAININGTEYTFSSYVVELSRQPLMLLKKLGKHLRLCSRNAGNDCERTPKVDVVTLLSCFDSAWAGFECQYITELMNVETKARAPIVAAVMHAKSLPAKEKDISYESWCVSLAPFEHQQKMLFERIAELNVMANIARKGRGDLDEDVLKVAIDILSSRDGYEECSDLTRSVCEDLLKSFEAMCKYLCALDVAMETVDPILSSNTGLVERLAEFEEAWEMAARFVGDASLRCSLDGVFSAVKMIVELEPAFQQMCSDCDVELFLVIPRVTWFSFLNAPTSCALVKNLLPHAFQDQVTRNELQTLCQQFQAIVLESPECEDILLRQLVHGPGTEEANAFVPTALQGMLATFMRDLERWSIELQRRNALDWNAFCAVVVRFLSQEK